MSRSLIRLVRPSRHDGQQRLSDLRDALDELGVAPGEEFYVLTRAELPETAHARRDGIDTSGEAARSLTPDTLRKELVNAVPPLVRDTGRREKLRSGRRSAVWEATVLAGDQTALFAASTARYRSDAA